MLGRSAPVWRGFVDSPPPVSQGLFDSPLWVDLPPLYPTVFPLLNQTQLIYGFVNASARLGTTCAAAYPTELWKASPQPAPPTARAAHSPSPQPEPPTARAHSPRRPQPEPTALAHSLSPQPEPAARADSPSLPYRASRRPGPWGEWTTPPGPS